MASQLDITYPTPVNPRQLRLDTTTACNACCISCHKFLSVRKGQMPFSLIEQVVNDVARWNPPLTEIVPVNYGEFFLRKDWAQILEFISTKLPSTQIVIPTNGQYLTEEGVVIISRIPQVKYINFSINAYFDETYEAFTGLPATNIQHIRKVIAQLKVLRSDINIWASMVFDPAYHTDLERDLFKNYWITCATPQIIPAASAGRGTKILIPRTTPCRSIFSDLVVGYDGKLSSCCFDSSFSLDLNYYTGDLHKDWHNSELIKLRRIHNDHRRNTIPLCAKCTFA